MTRHRIRHGRKLQAKGILAWTVLVYVVVQLALVAFIDTSRPGWVDREFQFNLVELRQRQGATPGSQVALLMGSSRMVTDFAAEWTEPIALPGGGQAVVCSVAHTTAGPLTNLMELQRLLRAGVKPRWVVMEILPAKFLHESPTNVQDLALISDLPLLIEHGHAASVLSRYARLRFNPFYRFRDQVLGEFAPAWLPDDLRKQIIEAKPWRDAIWQEGPGDQRARLEGETREGYFQYVHDLRILPDVDKTMHELLDLCRREGIGTVLLLSPEGSEFRSWYTPESRAVLHEYMGRLAGEYGLPVVDAQAWIADEDFIDQHHAARAGAEVFTRRVMEQVFTPLVRGEAVGP